MTQLLVSVRSAAEAGVALAGGAELIDIKEPANGPLGMAPLSVITDVLAVVSGRVPVSAAAGEARDAVDFLPAGIVNQLVFLKYGPAGCAGGERAVWDRTFESARNRLADMKASCLVVVTAYADWRRSRAPSPEELCRVACKHRAGPFLLDTWGKDGSTLLDWLPLAQVADLCRRCVAAGVPVALAGSLGPTEIPTLLPLQPTWIAVRGAACHGGQREKHIDHGKVFGLVEMIRAFTAATRAG
jgi:uncharacterized protein (UPF0264 family)